MGYEGFSRSDFFLPSSPGVCCPPPTMGAVGFGVRRRRKHHRANLCVISIFSKELLLSRRLPCSLGEKAVRRTG